MLEGFLSIGITLGLFAIGYFGGSLAERRHFASIRQREASTQKMVVCNFVPTSQRITEKATLVTGSVVVSLDYFKRLLASLRFIFGGRVKAFETLLDRARREAVLRMKADAQARGCDTIINVRIETSSIASKGAQKGVAGVEVLAFGTALQQRESVS